MNHITIRVTPRVSNILTSLAPTTDGLYLATSRSPGCLTLTFGTEMVAHVQALLGHIAVRYPGQIMHEITDFSHQQVGKILF